MPNTNADLSISLAQRIKHYQYMLRLRLVQQWGLISALSTSTSLKVHLMCTGFLLVKYRTHIRPRILQAFLFISMLGPWHSV